ncbi:MAG: PQQ-binding-like beta-propeller repeat protein [Capsulimonadales bacterium]|nr:PQQ-binding-like beta-propeller repeat protein [Capsulimonadales bacterium]
MNRHLFGAACVALLTLSAGTVGATDWPQWRGPNRDGISPETGLPSSFPTGGPKRLWSVNVGAGFSSVSVANGRLFTMGNDANQDIVSCLDPLTGRAFWQYRYPCGSGDYEGPRATPTVSGNNVYTLSREGLALCLNVRTGKVVWQRNIARETGAESPQWGFAGSPLLEGNLVIYNVGGGGTAVDRNTGRIVWRSGAGRAGYASPVAFVSGGRRAVAIFAGKGLVAVDPATGRQLWQYPWDTSYDVNAADPIFSGDNVFISSNYGKGGALLRIAGGRPTPVWENRSMKNHFNSSVLTKGALFGNDENTLRCVDFATGAERWSMRGIGKGGLIVADGKLLVLTERGELVLLNAEPGKMTELGRASVLRGTCWTHPVLANGLLYCRSHEGVLVCVELKSKRA